MEIPRERETSDSVSERMKRKERKERERKEFASSCLERPRADSTYGTPDTRVSSGANDPPEVIRTAYKTPPEGSSSVSVYRR